VSLLLHNIQSAAVALNDTKLNITVYFESYCKLSRKFMQQQLKPVYADIKDQVNFKFIPWGAAEVSILSQTQSKFID